MKSIMGLATTVCLLTGLSVEQASADIVYELKNINLRYLGKDAGALSGSFVTNDARTRLLDVNIVASGAMVSLSSWLPPTMFEMAVYTLENSRDHSNLNGSLFGFPLPGVISLTHTQGVAGALTLFFASGLDAAGKSSVTPGASGESRSKIGTRLVSSGTIEARRVEPPILVVAVPEPSTLAVAALCAPAILVYGWCRRGAASAA